MRLKEIADELVAGCREDRTRANLDRLYAADAVSVEPSDMGGGRETVGLEGIHGKHDWWEANFEVPALAVEGPGGRRLPRQGRQDRAGGVLLLNAGGYERSAGAQAFCLVVGLRLLLGRWGRFAPQTPEDI